jgi:hypothetical protein
MKTLRGEQTTGRVDKFALKAANLPRYGIFGVDATASTGNFYVY